MEGKMLSSCVYCCVSCCCISAFELSLKVQTVALTSICIFWSLAGVSLASVSVFNNVSHHI